MKKLVSITLLLFSVSLFFSCSGDDDEPPLEFDDWNNPRSENYKPEGYNPLWGEWTDKISMLLFTKDFEFKQLVRGDNTWSTMYSRRYKLNDKVFKIDKPYEYPRGSTDKFQYILDADTLSVRFPGGGVYDFIRVRDENGNPVRE